MSRYDFIGILERKCESLACMRFLWHDFVMTPNDLIVLSAKQSGSYDDGQYHSKCVKIRSPSSTGKTNSTIFKDVQKFLKRWFPHRNHDYALYSVVNRSLDKTIAGPTRGPAPRVAPTASRRTVFVACHVPVLSQWNLAARRCQT